MTIRHYKEKDREDVRHVCLSSDGPFDGNADDAFYILNTYCDYYIEQEPENCFVAADENDRAVGYVICTEDYDKYYAKISTEYVSRLRPDDRDRRDSVIHSADPQRGYKSEYPAHLHIDLLPEYQRMGLGHKLVDALCDHLRKKNIPGVMLTTGVDNVKGRNFYRKYGFTELMVCPECVAYGIRL